MAQPGGQPVGDAVPEWVGRGRQAVHHACDHRLGRRDDRRPVQMQPQWICSRQRRNDHLEPLERQRGRWECGLGCRADRDRLRGGPPWRSVSAEGSRP
jgi:hypothetical protein